MDTDQKNILKSYIERYRSALIDTSVIDDLLKLKNIFESAQARNAKVLIAGNGGSAAIASHCSVDLTKNAGVRCVNFNEADLITCLSNDYGYESWLVKALELYADKGDVVVLISSSGKSANMVNAAHFAASHGMDLVTFTGFSSDNPLRALGKLNFWVNSKAYNLVEMVHHIWLLAVCDMIVGNMEYPPS